MKLYTFTDKQLEKLLTYAIAQFISSVLAEKEAKDIIADLDEEAKLVKDRTIEKLVSVFEIGNLD